MKKLCSLLLCMVITLTLCSGVFAERSYLKGASDWAKEEIINARGAGVLSWRLDIRENEWTRDITRSMVSGMLADYCRATGCVPEKYDTDPFNDSDSQDVKLLYANGIVKGVSGNSFQPWREITREEIAVMLERTLLLTMDEKEVKSFEKTPIDGVSPWAQDAVLTVQQYGIFQINDATQSHVTWEETVVALWRVFRYTPKGKAFLTYSETTPEILVELGIVTKEDYSKDGYITKGEAVVTMAKAFGIDYSAIDWKTVELLDDGFEKEFDDIIKKSLYHLYRDNNPVILTYEEANSFIPEENMTTYEALVFLTRAVEDNKSCLLEVAYPDAPRSYIYEQAVNKDLITEPSEETADNYILRKDFYNLLHKVMFTEYIRGGYITRIARYIDGFQIKNDKQ